MEQARIESFASMLDTGVARLRRDDLTLEDKHKTLIIMRGLANRLAQDIEENLIDNQIEIA
jgi:hypothetical protein